MTQEQTIPVVDLCDFTHGDEAMRAAFVQKLGEAIVACGFAAIENHGVPQELIDANYDIYQRFFALEDDTKRRYEDPDTGRQRGYTSFGVEHAKNNTKPDLKEFFHVGRELPKGVPSTLEMPANQWPDDVMPELKTLSLDLYKSMDACACALLSAISLYLGQAQDFLPGMAKDGSSIIRIIHYPVCDGFDEPGVMRAAQHEDINLMTLLPPSTESGLELLGRDGEWLPIHAIPGQMIIDTGDMMSRITNGKLPAMTHRVVNPSGEPTARYSMPFFVHPRPEVLLEVLPDCLGDGEAPKHPPITSGDFLHERLRDIGVKK